MQTNGYADPDADADRIRTKNNISPPSPPPLNTMVGDIIISLCYSELCHYVYLFLGLCIPISRCGGRESLLVLHYILGYIFWSFVTPGNLVRGSRWLCTQNLYANFQP